MTRPDPSHQAAALRRILSDLRQLDSPEDLALVLDVTMARLGEGSVGRVVAYHHHRRFLERLAAVERGEFAPLRVGRPSPMRDRSRLRVVYDLGEGWECEVLRRSGAWLGGMWRLLAFTAPDGARYEVAGEGEEEPLAHLLRPDAVAVRAYRPGHADDWPIWEPGRVRAEEEA